MWPFKRKRWERLGIPLEKAEIWSILQEYVPDNVTLEDGNYRAIPYKDFEYLMENKRWEDPVFAHDKFDCNSFCITFMADIKRAWADLSEGQDALAFGMVTGEDKEDSQHAWIWQIDDQKNVNWIEPQTNKRKTGEPYRIRNFSA